MPQYVGIAIGRRDLEVVKIAPGGSVWSRCATPDALLGADSSSDADAPRTLVDAFTDALSKGGDRVNVPDVAPADVEGADLDGVQRRIATDEPVSIGDHDVAPAKVTMLIVDELLDSLGVTTVAYATVAVPSDFDREQRDVVETGVEGLGVDVLDVVDRPNAAARVGGSLAPHDRTCVYEYGDAFRTTLLDTEDGTVERVASTDGRTPTRGAFDAELGAHLVSKYVEGEPDVPSVARSQPLKRVANRVRRELRATGAVEVGPSDVPDLAGPVVVDDELVADATTDVVETTLAATDELFDDPDVAVLPWQVDALVLTGDVARVPPVAEAVADLFEAEVLDPEWTRYPTAAGAAMAAIDDAPTDHSADDVLSDEEDSPENDERSESGEPNAVGRRSETTAEARADVDATSRLFLPAALPYVGALASVIDGPTPVVELDGTVDENTDRADRGLGGFLLTVICSFLAYLLFAQVAGSVTTLSTEVTLAVAALSVAVTATVVGISTMSDEGATRGRTLRGPTDSVEAEEVFEPGFASWVLAVGLVGVALFAVVVIRGLPFGGVLWTIKVLVYGAVAVVLGFLLGTFVGAFVGAFLGLEDEGAAVGYVLGVLAAVLQTLDWGATQPEYGALWLSNLSLGPVRVDVLVNLLLGVAVPVTAGIALLAGLWVVAVRPFVDRYERGYAVNPINWTIPVVVPFLAAVFVTLDGHAAMSLPGVGTVGRAELWLACLALPPVVGLAYGFRRTVEHWTRARG